MNPIIARLDKAIRKAAEDLYGLDKHPSQQTVLDTIADAVGPIVQQHPEIAHITIGDFRIKNDGVASFTVEITRLHRVGTHRSRR